MVKFVRFSTLFRVYESIQPYLKVSFPLEATLPGRNVLVLAPHADDEAIGCGGALVLHARRKGNASVVFCTGGDAAREEEAKASARVLGVGETVFLDYPPETLKEEPTFAGRLTRIFEEKRPDIVFMPFWLDNHTDHRAVNEALFAVAEKGAFSFMVYAYPVWFPLYPNVLVDIGGVWEKKKEAISCYQSQLATRDYITMSHSLGRYWAAVKGKDCQVAESFLRLTLPEYVALGRKIFQR